MKLNVKKVDRPFVFYSDTLSILANIGARYMLFVEREVFLWHFDCDSFRDAEPLKILQTF